MFSELKVRVFKLGPKFMIAVDMIYRKLEEENWVNGGFNKIEDGQRLLLWHGSRSTNFAGV